MLDAERLRQRMSDRDLSQSELARRVGVTQTTIRKLVSGAGYGSKYLHKIARELGTTPAYLEGETDDPEAGAPEEVPLDYFQRELLELVAMLTPADKKAVMQIVRSMVGVADPKNFKGFSETLHSPKQEYRGKE